jgi:plexin A
LIVPVERRSGEDRRSEKRFLSRFAKVFGCPAGAQLDPTENVNKLLLIDRSRGRLMVCGSLFQGRCEVRSTRNISDDNALRVIKEGVVANNRTASTVGFIAPGPIADSSINVKPQVLYVGVTFIGGNFPYR